MDCARVLTWAGGMTLLLLSLGSSGWSAAPAISGITIEPQRVGRYEKVELTFRLSQAYDNPFDPDEIDVAAEIRTPSGRGQTA